MREVVGQASPRSGPLSVSTKKNWVLNVILIFGRQLLKIHGARRTDTLHFLFTSIRRDNLYKAGAKNYGYQSTCGTV